MTYQPTIFDGARQSIDDAIDLTVESLRAYGSRYDHWSLAYSMGKDSTCLLTLVIHLIESGQVPRPKKLYVLNADTRMELPPLAWAGQRIGAECRKRDWIDFRVVLPDLDQRFFVYMLGRGVPPPNNNTLRWCTAQIKVEPMEAELRRVAAESPGKVLMLIGVRLGESAARDQRIAVACSRNGAECGQGWYQRDLPDAVCDKLSPILHWRQCLVWDWLMYGDNSHREGPTAGESRGQMFDRLKRNAARGPSHGFPTEIVADAYGAAPDDHPDEINGRTGCVGCPLATEDTALDKLLANYPKEWGYLAPLKSLRPLYRELREPRNRLRQPPGEKRKDGTLTSNQNRMGPLTMAARLDALNRILSAQAAVNEEARRLGRPPIDLLNAEEEARIRELIDANTWPQKWTGSEPVADELYEATYGDGSRQLLLPVLNGGTEETA